MNTSIYSTGKNMVEYIAFEWYIFFAINKTFASSNFKATILALLDFNSQYQNK